MASIITCNKPKVHFNISKHTSAECLASINTMTNNAIINNSNNEFFKNMAGLVTKYNNAWYGTIDVPTEVGLLKQIIGKGGLHLKRITVKYGVYIIWHDRTCNKLIVWGTKPSLISTLHALLRHINKVTIEREKLEKDVISIENNMKVVDIQQKTHAKSMHREREDDDEHMTEPSAKKMKLTTP